MFLNKKNVGKAEKNPAPRQTETAGKADKVRELQLALLERVNGGICKRACQ